jgi:general secretion pathway protein N
LIRSKRGLLAAGILVLLLGLIVMFPARVAVHWFVPDSVMLSGIQGTAWHGSANEASMNGFYCRDIRWHINPVRLFVGELSYRVEATPLSGFIETDVGLGLGGVLTLSNLTASLPLSLVAGAAGLRGLQGSASLAFERIAIVDGLATAANGTLQLANLIVPIVSRESLGGYKAEFFTQNSGIAASIEDTDGAVDLAGSFELKSDRTYQFTGQVVAKPETSQALRQQMQFLPPANSRGQQEIRFEGVL